jgi:hypothetical protein
MPTPYELLERIATEVAPHVPGSDMIVHVEVQFAERPTELRFQSTPYDKEELYDLSLRTPIDVPETLVTRVRHLANEYFDLMQTRSELGLVFLRLSVKDDGDFLVGQTHKQRQQN